MKLTDSDIKAIAKEVGTVISKQLAELAASIASDPASKSELTSKEVATLLDVSVQTIERLTARGEIPSYKVGRIRRYNRDAVLKAMQQSTSSAS